MAVSIMMYDSKTVKLGSYRADRSRIQAAAMCFSEEESKVAKMDTIRNDGIGNELNIFSLNQRVDLYSQKSRKHVDRIGESRFKRQIDSTNQ